MNLRDSDDRLLVAWLDQTAGVGTAGYLDETLLMLEDIDQRSAWLSPGRWLPVQLAIPHLAFPRLAPLLAVIGLLLAAALVASGIVGSRPTLPPPFGRAATGRLRVRGIGRSARRRGGRRRQRSVTGGPGWESRPSFSRDGTRIAYWSSAGGFGRSGLWVADVDGGDTHKVSGIVSGNWPWDNRISSAAASWAPDGRELVITSYTDELYILAADGGHFPLRLPASGVHRTVPVWSPDGSLIAFYAEGPSRPSGIYVIRPDGTGERQVSLRPTRNAPLSLGWSPDGRALVYDIGDETDPISRSPGGSSDDWVETIVVGGPAFEAWPQFSNDGARISFIRSDGAEPGTIVVADLDGSNQRPLMAGLGPRLAGWAPQCWTPDDRSIIALTARRGMAIGDDRDPGFTVMSVDGPEAPTLISTPGQTSYESCSWQRLAVSG